MKKKIQFEETSVELVWEVLIAQNFSHKDKKIIVLSTVLLLIAGASALPENT